MGKVISYRNRRTAFTLIELLVVVAIIGILTAIAVYNFALAADRARQVSCATRLKTIGYALYAYRLDHNTYPLADGVAGNLPTPLQTDFGNGPAGNGFWNGISLLLVQCHYITDPNILYCPSLERRYLDRHDYLRYAYNCSTADAGGYEGSDNNIFSDSGDIWLCRCLYLHPDLNGAGRRRTIEFPHGLDHSMENVLFSNGRVELRPGGEKTPQNGSRN
jgi:prepilin-type N-terminal cleavage/methylation domain-containing protein